MESKKGIKDSTSRMAEKERAKAILNAEAAGKGTDFNNEKTTQPVRSSRTRKYRSGDSDGDFLSSMKSNKTTILGLAGALAGGALLFRSLKRGRSASNKAHEIRLHSKQTVRRSREELYAYWRNLENLPNFMSHIKEVQEIDERRSSWTAEIPGGMGTIEWDAVIEQDITNSYISWRSVADADIENAGEVRFKDAPAGKGTIVETTISYLPPAGKAGEYVAELLNPAFEKVVKNDLKQFKKHMEQGGEERNQLFL